MDLGLSGRSVLLSHGATPLGRAVAARLAGEGARVACGMPDGADGLRDVTAIPLLVGDAVRAMEQLVRDAVAAGGPPDILVAEMAEPLAGTLDDIAAHQLAAYLDATVAGLWAFVRAGAEHLRGGGRIVVLVNAAGKIPSCAHMAAAVAGAAQLAFVKSCSDHLGPRGITVNAVCVGDAAPEGAIGTDAFLGRGLGQQESRWGAAPPLGRWCTPPHVAEAVAFLASARAAFITGANMDVDGGQQRMIF